MKFKHFVESVVNAGSILIAPSPPEKFSADAYDPSQKQICWF